MRLAAGGALLCLVLGLQISCSQAGEGVRPGEAPAPGDSKAVCAPGERNACVPERTPVQLRPAVPPVPDSPIKVNCARLPTQVERDTCTNRKESTG